MFQWRRQLAILTMVGLVGSAGAGELCAAGPAPDLKVLFLGDRGHHRPADRAAELIPVLAGRGIEITYTEDLADLNRATLTKYDVLLVYANIDRIEPAQEQALLEYVAGGKGFAPIHCASYCFRNSEKVVGLMGAQFERHGTGDFETNVSAPEHPIMIGLTPFKTWDETYVHRFHNPQDRIVLQTRTEGAGEEPWTWVRTHGKGRVFYTAYGHDARTWSQPGFQALIERGLRWAANKGEVFDSLPKAHTGLPPFQYETANLPNYLPGKSWGVQGEPVGQMQLPVSPDESRRHGVVPRDFELSLFAAEPEIGKPLALAWDHRGRLWIAESVDYPNSRQPVGAGRDRIKICEDTDGDGRADKFTVFADKLSIPTSMVFAKGGLIVHQAPDTLFLKDTDGDDQADERRVLFTGWNTSDTHAGPSNMRWGFDNWIWGMVGYAGFQGEIGGEKVEFRTGFYRFRPDGSKLEFLRNTNNNSWGVGLSEEGLVFGSTANGTPSVFLAVPNRYYESVRGWSSSVLDSIALDSRFYAITEKVRQVDWHGRFTAGAGHALYTARTYPPFYWNRTAFVNEPTGHLTATFLLEPQGSNFTSFNAWNLLASDDEWTAPIVAEVGPDGHVWVIDWYNYIVQHNPTPKGFTTGKGNAYETPLRDKTHGRVYRVVYKPARPGGPRTLDPTDPAQLLAGLRSDNQFWRMHAQRLLVERGRPDVAAALADLTRDRTSDAIGLNAPAIHALWTLHGLAANDSACAQTLATAAAAALSHPSAGVRRNALQVLPRTPESAERVVNSGLLSDADAQVRLAAFLALADLPAVEAAGPAIADALQRSNNLNDRWIPDAATSAAAVNALPVLRALAVRTAAQPPAPAVLELTARVAEHVARQAHEDSVAALVSILAGGHPQIDEAIVAALVKGWPKNHPVQLARADEQALVKLLEKLPATGRGQLTMLASVWGSPAFEKYASEIKAGFLAAVANDREPASRRIAAAEQLVDFRKTDPRAAEEVLGLITPRTAPDLAVGLVNAAGRSAAPETGTGLVEKLPSLTPAVRSAALRALLTRSEWTAALLSALDQGQVQLAELSLDQKQALAAHPDKKLADRAKKLLNRGGGLPSPDRQKVIDELSPKVLAGGDAGQGKLVFKQQCAKCHRHGGEGATIGPDLTGMAAHPKQELLIHILDPNRSVEGNFRLYTVVTDEGRVFNGLLASETKTAVELIDVEGKKQTILHENIDEFVATVKSLMPEGFEKQLSPAALSDLLEFLTQRGKYLPLDLRKVATISSTQGMFYSKDANAERLIFDDWSPKSFAGVPFHLVDPQGGRAPNVIMLYGPTGEFPPTMPKSVSVPCNAPVKTIHLLSGVSGWGYNGSPVEPTVSMTVRLHYADGATEDHALKNGIHFADYIRVVDVPESKLAFKLRGQQVRYVTVNPQRDQPISTIEFLKGPDRTAPLVMAVTVEGKE